VADSKIIIGVLVNNKPGVLMHITELFTKRCFNIDSLVVGMTEKPAISRMTITSIGDVQIENQIVKQLSKLHDVLHVAVIPENKATVREHMLIKMEVTAETSSAVTEMINAFAAKVIDFTASTVTAEVTGEVENNDRFVEASKEYGIIEICRAGAQALHRGNTSL